MGKDECGADDLALTASTSEAYAFLFKLLCNSQDEVLIGTPSYPLLEHLAALELITLRTFPLEFHGRWEIDVAALQQAVTNRVRDRDVGRHSARRVRPRPANRQIAGAAYCMVRAEAP